MSNKLLGIFDEPSGGGRGTKKRSRANNEQKTNNNNKDEEESENDNQKASVIIVSIVENRAREICISKMDTHNVSYSLFQLLKIYKIPTTYSSFATPYLSVACYNILHLLCIFSSLCVYVLGINATSLFDHR